MNLYEIIPTISGLELTQNADLTRYTTMRLASKGDLIEVTSVSALQKLLPLLNQNKKEYLVLGWGANQILPAINEKIILHLNFPFDSSYLDQVRDEYHFPASLGINHLTAHAVKFGLKGWEVFTGIPASLGGAIYMNAGTNLGEIGALISQVSLITPMGELRDEIIIPGSFSYRKNHFVKAGEVIIEARMKHLGINPEVGPKIKEYLEYRKKSQPLATRNCGCVFKNPLKEIPAGKLIDLLGLKGLQVGDLRVSPKHGNFMENLGNANYDQFQSLLDIIKFQTDHFYGIEFELEVKIPYH